MSFNFEFTIDIELERKLMISKIYGVWKIDTAHQYHKEYMEVAKPLIGDKWAKLVNASNWISGAPEIVRMISDHIRWSLENGNVLAVYYTHNPMATNKIKQMFNRGGGAKISRIVGSREEAEKFLRKNGF